MDDFHLEPAHDLGLERMARYRSYAREGGLAESIVRLGWWSLVRGTFGVWNRLKFHGRENIPDRPSFVLAANHLSHLDVMVLGCALPLGWRDYLFPLGAQDVFFEKLSIAGFVATAFNALPVRRRGVTGHALEELRERMVAEPRITFSFPKGRVPGTEC
jgi:1-acyl-sn-glycerol-3-phosphate acyltransferase